MRNRQDLSGRAGGVTDSIYVADLSSLVRWLSSVHDLNNLHSESPPEISKQEDVMRTLLEQLQDE